MKLANRIFTSFVLVVLLSVVASAVTGAILISSAVRSEAISRVDLGLGEARSEVQANLSSLLLTARIHARGLENELSTSEIPDIASLFVRGIPEFLANRGLSSTRSQTGFVRLTESDLAELGYTPTRLQRLAVCDDGSFLCQYALAHGTRGTAFIAQILNGNAALVVRLQKKLFGTEMYGDKPFGTVTIFCGDIRVATTVLGPGGTVAIGTKVSEEVRERVLVQGETWLRRAYVVDEWYLSAYEPIVDPTGRNIGILYVGVIEQKYADIRNRTLLFLSVIVIPIIGLVFVTAYFISRGIVRPISELVQAADTVGQGKFNTLPQAGPSYWEIERLSDAFQRMQSALKEREERLNLRNDELREANRDYQELLSFVTHELNNSIGSLLLNMSILAEDAEEDESFGTESKEIVMQVLRDVDRFRAMVRNYLNLSRLEKGTLRYSPGKIDLRVRVIEPVLSRMQRWISYRGFTVNWEWPEEVTVHGDADLLDIVVSNFIVNALKYGSDWIRFSAQEETSHWIFCVSNGGNHIPPEKITLLFQKFSRLVNSDDGAGLGLYLVKQIVDRHNGEVWCESDQDTGTRFYVKLSKA